MRMGLLRKFISTEALAKDCDGRWVLLLWKDRFTTRGHSLWRSSEESRQQLIYIVGMTAIGAHKIYLHTYDAPPQSSVLAARSNNSTSKRHWGALSPPTYTSKEGGRDVLCMGPCEVFPRPLVRRQTSSDPKKRICTSSLH